MFFLDLNVRLSAFRPDASERARAVRTWLEPGLNGHEVIGVKEFVLSSMMRIATNHRVFNEPSTPQHAVAFVEASLDAPAARIVRPATRHWLLFRDLVTMHRLRVKRHPGRVPRIDCPGSGSVDRDARSWLCSVQWPARRATPRRSIAVALRSVGVKIH